MAVLFMAITLYSRTFYFSKYMIIWKAAPFSSYVIIGLSAFGLLVLMLILMFPYIEVSHLYGFKRSYGEIASMLPTIKSYFLADLSPIWGPISSLFGGISMRHEQQLFIGIFPIVLLVGSLFIAKQKQHQLTYWVMGSTILLFLYLH